MNRTIVLLTLLLMQGLSSRPKQPLEKDGNCAAKKYIAQVSMPGTFDPECRRFVELTKCEGFCRSTAIPVVVHNEARIDYTCNACYPVEYTQMEIVFPRCGGSILKDDIKKCGCAPCGRKNG